MHKNTITAYIMLVVSSVIFGFSFLFTKDTLVYLDIFQLLGIRFLIASVIMTLIVLTGIIKINLTRKKLKGIFLLTLFQPVVYFICETFGVKLTSSSESGMMIALIPIFVALFSRFLLKEKLRLVQWISICVSVVGVVFIIGARGFNLGSGSFAGFMLLLGAVIAAGLYSPLSRKLSAHSSPFEITFVMMWIGALAFNAIGVGAAAAEGTLSTYITAAFSPGALPGVLYLGVLSSIVAFLCINYAVSKIRTSRTASFANLTTVISILAGTLLGGERIYTLQIIGIVLILLSIWGVLKTGSKKDKQAEQAVNLPG